MLAAYPTVLRLQCCSYINTNDIPRLTKLVLHRKWLATEMLDDAYSQLNKEAFESLLKAGAKPDGVRYERLTLTHHAAGKADAFWLEKLLEYGANPNYHDVIRNIYPMMDAIEENRPDNVRLLIAAGADINAWTYRKESMLTYAWSMRKGEIAMILLEAGALVNPPSPRHESYINTFQRMSEERYALDERGERDEDCLEKVRQHFRDLGLDLWNATWDDAQGDFGVWTIPSYTRRNGDE
ncbi:MAG: ankyrin repeat domain-containing protein [Planctomycetaceae bacterium]